MITPSPSEQILQSLNSTLTAEVGLKKGDDEGMDGEEVGQTEGASSRFLVLFLKSNLR